MSDRLKKIILIIGIIIVTILLGWLFWYLFFQPATPPVVTTTPPEVTTPTPRPGGLPPAATSPTGAITPGSSVTTTPGAGVPPKATTEETISPTAVGGLTEIRDRTAQPTRTPVLADNGRDINFYDPELGQFYRIDPSGAATLMTDTVFRDVETVTWAPTGTQAILEFPDGANIMYDFATKQQTTLPKHWAEFDFSGTGNEIAFKSIGIDPNDRWLAIANPDGSGARIIEEMGENADKFEINWSPNEQIVATFRESRDGIRQELYFIGQHRENFTLATLEGRQFVGTWSPEGNQMLYSVYSPLTDLKPSLWVVDAAPGVTGENRQHLNLETWADKCVFSSDNVNVFCAVPKELPRGAGITRDAVRDEPDNFYRLNTQTGAKEIIAIPATDVIAEQMMLSRNESILSFLDQRTGTIKEIRLK